MQAHMMRKQRVEVPMVQLGMKPSSIMLQIVVSVLPLIFVVSSYLPNLFSIFFSCSKKDVKTYNVFGDHE